MHKTLYFMLTEFCPNRCKYCYISNRHDNQSIDINLVERKIEEHKPNRIILFGGEPLVELDKVKYLYQKYYKKIKLEVVTSTSANYIDFIKDIYSKVDPRYFTLQVSWDGFCDNRIDCNGENISHRTFKNIMATRDYTENPFDIKCVISDDNVDELVRIHNQFMVFIKNNISGQFVIAHRPQLELNKPFITSLSRSLYDIFTLDHAYTMHLNMLCAYINRDKDFMSCDVTKYQVIDLNGRESYCTALSQIKDYTFDFNDLVNTPDQCLDCKYNILCDGGCRYERYMLYKDDWKNTVNINTCELSKLWYDTCEKIMSTFHKESIVDTILRYKRHLRDYYREEI